MKFLGSQASAVAIDRWFHIFRDGRWLRLVIVEMSDARLVPTLTETYVPPDAESTAEAAERLRIEFNQWLSVLAAALSKRYHSQQWGAVFERLRQMGQP